MDTRSAAAEPAQMLITLLHGTWARGAQWSHQENGALREYLRGRFGSNVLFFAPEWSGRNTVSARARGAVVLQEHVLKVATEYPRGQHFVIGHSHGGNVALYALRDPAVAEHVSGIISLATPFLHARRRRSKAGEFAFGAAGFAVLVTIWAISPRLTFGLDARLAFPLVYGLAVGLLVASAMWLSERLESIADRLIGVLDYESFATPLLIVRAAGDESIGLGLIRFRGHLPKGGYDVQSDGRDSQAPAAPAIR